MDRRRVVLLLVTLLLMVSSKPVAAQDDAMVTEDVTFELTLPRGRPSGRYILRKLRGQPRGHGDIPSLLRLPQPILRTDRLPGHEALPGDGTTYIVKTIVTRYEFAEVDFGIVRLYQQGGRVEQNRIADSPFDTQEGPNFSFTYTYPDSGTDSRAR